MKSAALRRRGYQVIAAMHLFGHVATYPLSHMGSIEVKRDSIPLSIGSILNLLKQTHNRQHNRRKTQAYFMHNLLLSCTPHENIVHMHRGTQGWMKRNIPSVQRIFAVIIIFVSRFLTLNLKETLTSAQV